MLFLGQSESVPMIEMETAMSVIKRMVNVKKTKAGKTNENADCVRATVLNRGSTDPQGLRGSTKITKLSI